MLNKGANLFITDKSGAKRAHIINLLKKELAFIGDTIVIVVKKAVKKKTTKKLAQKGKMYQALIIKLKISFLKISGFKVKFQKKGAILLKKNEREPYSVRVNGAIAIEVRQRGFLKVLGMSNFII